MLFNSLEFLIFLPFVFLCYWYLFSKNKLTQNIFLLFSSYVFYAFWDWRFLFLLLFSTGIDYFLGILINNSDVENKRKWLLRLSVFIKILILCYFKYADFFVNSFIEFFYNLGIKIKPFELNILLPIGISFYTFHGISYLTDIFYNRIKPVKSFIEYSLFVSYFPLLVAGPIERATHLLPQLDKKRKFNYKQSISGLQLMLWGMFKKVVVADSLANVVNNAFTKYEQYNGISLIVGVISLSFLIYGDFSGYSDIARGVSKLFGIELLKNFNLPYFSRSIGEYWSRWHISLSSWLNDYVFTPLALKFRNWGKLGVYLAIFITFLISGFWHGAAWHYVAQGFLFSTYYIPIVFSKKRIKLIEYNKDSTFSFLDVFKIVRTYIMVCIGYVYFRAESLQHAWNYLTTILSSLYHNPYQLLSLPEGWECILIIAPIIIGDLMIRKYKTFENVPVFLKYCSYLILGLAIFFCFDKKTSFVYFQF